MSLTDVEIRREYRSLHRNVVTEFYTPLLSESVLYRRAVGFFSSTALICLTEGIKGLLKNGGRLEVIASPRLTDEDLAAIRDGFDRRNEIIEKCLLRELDEPKGKFEEARLNLLSNLIAAGVLTIKIAVLESGGEVGMFHEKLGLMYDSDGNVVAFSGSMNETANAYHLNYESFDVFASWTSDADRVYDKQSAFSAMWGDYEPGVIVMEFQSVSDEIINRYRRSEGIDYRDLDVQPQDVEYDGRTKDERRLSYPHVPNNVVLREYQSKAIQSWSENNYRGIFDMATGTGKTYTALAAICRLSEVLKHNLAVIIVCPYQHLVEQWKDDVILFGMKPIVSYSASEQKNWRNRIKNSVSGFRLGAVERFCVITTNATFGTDFMQQQIARLRGNCLLVVDEAHNFGATKAMRALPNHFGYRLALSATIERYGDEEGTQALFEYFGPKCIEYTLEDAINNGMLTPYYYHPIIVYLDGEELTQYIELSKQIARAIASSGSKQREDLSSTAKMLLIKRARIVAGAQSKITKLKEVISPYRNGKHILVYCGATTIQDADYHESSPGEDETRQIDAVTYMLGQKLGMRVAQFTSNENPEKRRIIRDEFADGTQMQALVAIRCLDEGVNIPSIETAFILASSTNPKEYIQRRGRVLRKAEGKKYATIYDFVTLPMPIDEVNSYPSDVVNSSKSLAAREIERMRDFALISENPAESLLRIGEIMEAFNIGPDDQEGGAYV